MVERDQQNSDVLPNCWTRSQEGVNAGYLKSNKGGKETNHSIVFGKMGGQERKASVLVEGGGLTVFV